MMKNFWFFWAFAFGLQLSAQHRAWIFLPENAARSAHPALGEAALARREQAGLTLDARDFPLHPQWTAQAQAAGIQVLYASRWLGALAVEATSDAEIRAFAQSCQGSIQPLRTMVKHQTSGSYGTGEAQVAVLNGQDLHNKGFWGEGRVIAVLDGGFSGAQIFGAFDSLWMNNRIAGTFDFVDGDTNVFNRGSHGMSVLSVMGANLPGTLVGVAPRATYWLLTTENELSETIAEEYNWVAGAEFADSVGAHIINSSLGYTTFDDTLQSHTYADLDGRTTPVSLGALWAARKGILVVNSAGNEGSSAWQYISAPADADSILAVGGCNMNGDYVMFSGRGPSADNRLKPDVMAPAMGVSVVTGFGGISGANGTSFASPLIAGLAACLWQAHPGKTAMEIREEIIRSAHLFATPDNFRGHGIPDFWVADYALSTQEMPDIQTVNWFPNPSADGVLAWSGADLTGKTLEWVSLGGQVVYSHVVAPGEEKVSLPQLKPGLYVIRLNGLRSVLWLRL
jgi:subtilisin family serine protease